MNHLKISTRLALLMGVLSTLLVAVGGLGLFGISKSNDALKTVYERRTVAAQQMGEIRALMLHIVVAIDTALVTPSPEVIKTSVDSIVSDNAQAAKIWEVYSATTLTPEEALLGNAFSVARKTFEKEAVLPIVESFRANDWEEAKVLTVDKVRPLFATLEKSNEAVSKVQLDEAKREFSAAVARFETIRMLSMISVATGLIFSLLFGWTMIRSISRELGGEPFEAATMAQRVAAGDLRAQAELKSGDKTSLIAQLNAMQQNLAHVVGNVRHSAEGVASGSGQIAQGNQTLSQRTEEQSRAIETTTASMEQLSATVMKNASNAHEANQLALGASSVAVKGGEVVNQVVSTMKGINDSSKKIADIIGVIDGIAFQTNILALNAAVEAARAGEQGRGFAVVASEVRSLAGRSADAAKEIKSLINASVERVEHGTALVDQAGVTMMQVVDSIKRVTDIMGEISAAITEQSAGVARVGEAVTQMDRATQQNVTLVEESAIAAESLKAQAQQLVQAVAVFNLGHDR